MSRAPADEREPALATFFAACTPEGWRLASVTRRHDGQSVVLEDPRGRAHELDVWRRRDGVRALFEGHHVALGLRRAEVPDPPAYRALFDAVVRRELELTQLWEAAPRSGRDAPHFVTESELVRSLGRSRLRGEGARAWLDAHVPRLEHFILYLEAPCRQACEFCEEPQRRHEPLHRGGARLIRVLQQSSADLVASGMLAALLDALAARAPKPRFTLMGHDWLEHPRLDALLDVLAVPRGVPLRCYGPGTRLADPALAARVASLPDLGVVGLTLQSSDPSRHDAIVGAPGAGLSVQQAITHLRALAAPIEVTVVLSRRALPGLASTCRWLADRGLSASLQAFVPDRTFTGAGAIHPPLDALRAALAEVDPVSVAAIVGVPRCTVPDALLDRWRTPIDGPRRDAFAHLDACHRCAARDLCPGVPASYAIAFGARGLEAR